MYIEDQNTELKVELIRYQNRKLGMFEWYKSLNKFLENVDNLKVVIK